MTVKALTASQIFLLQTHESIRVYVRQLAGWTTADARRDFLETLELIERAEDEPELAARLLAAKPKDLDDLINGSLLDLDEDL